MQAEHHARARRAGARLPAARHGAGAHGEAARAPDPPGARRHARPAGRQRRSRASASTRRCRRVGAELAFAYPDLSDELRLVNLELRAGKATLRSAAQPGRSHRRRRPQLARHDADSDRQVRHERRAVAARLLRDAAHQAPSARGRSGGQDRRQDGVPARLLHLPGDLGRDDRSGGDQVRHGAVPAGRTTRNSIPTRVLSWP